MRVQREKHKFGLPERELTHGTAASKQAGNNKKCQVFGELLTLSNSRVRRQHTQCCMSIPEDLLFENAKQRILILRYNPKNYWLLPD